jgi:hypothetical protein
MVYGYEEGDFFCLGFIWFYGWIVFMGICFDMDVF